ncbi:T9SS type A sorting domain-containing protein [Vicingaceae bacterium]|nr:T9SS type A sorting domain-containing protein [Vicingaceae bacterium]
MSENATLQHCDVFGLDGRLLISANDNNQMDISRLSPNVYLLKITTDKAVVFKKIVKH